MSTNESPLVQSLWKRWLEDNDQSAANELIDNYMYLVSYHVERVSINLPSNVSKDDLKSFGMMGLFDALTKFQHSRELKFDTYASFRIRGAIIDGLRKEDWLPRSIREKAKKVEQASQELEQIYQRDPTSEEIAKKLQMSAEEVEELARDSLVANILSIEEKPNKENEHKEGIGYTIPDQSSVQPDDHMLQSELKDELIESMQSLNQNEQMVVSLFYHEELTLTEIGHILELTTSRISQIHRKAIFKLRKSLQKIQANL
ncbi:RNA polymerase, sigma 28 subunit, SigD/FliA/WhiG [Lentibacillus halodurans]|uniref:RNA polymerase, sigma 28 subunit, SigD/FliA/WhiG n=1 Tax=Lentibacillus halodurans TaxID=237679 RepID=A0A1I0VMJ2_9BACI|nr:FliA/WhiG family RNA polymerase sigma factor [Lentibacillus halodurans]SFA77217.1 RNA polymerase, sigma 28 subunit, SigD/FliA/WhiG [Lentibacillus halodurans]